VTNPSPPPKIEEEEEEEEEEDKDMREPGRPINSSSINQQGTGHDKSGTLNHSLVTLMSGDDPLSFSDSPPPPRKDTPTPKREIAPLTRKRIPVYTTNLDDLDPNDTFAGL
jgi:hypothetical protein